MDKKKLEELTADHELWDNRELGASVEHFAFISDAEQREIEEGFGLQMISLRLRKGLIEQFKALAKLESIGYQPLMRLVLTQYAKENEHKLDIWLSAAETAQLADKLFLQAVKLRDEIVKLVPLSKQRIFVEADYSTALGRAQALFTRIYGSSEDPVLKQHARLRVSQIRDLCTKPLPDLHDKKRELEQAPKQAPIQAQKETRKQIRKRQSKRAG